MRQQARADDGQFGITKNKSVNVSFLCVCPVIDNEFRHNIVKVVCESTRLSPRGSTATLTVLRRNSWSITRQTHEKLTLVNSMLPPHDALLPGHEARLLGIFPFCTLEEENVKVWELTMSRKRKVVADEDEDPTKIEFETSEEVDVVPTFDQLKLREDLLRGVYAYGKCGTG